MNSESLVEACNKPEGSQDSEGPEEHIDHTYSSACNGAESDVPYSALSPETMGLKKKIRRLQRRAQRQKHKIKTMKQLIKQLHSCCYGGPSRLEAPHQDMMECKKKRLLDK